MGRKKLRDCSRCGVRHGPPIGRLCVKEIPEFEKKNGEMGGVKKVGDVTDAMKSADQKAQTMKEKPVDTLEIPRAPTYKPLGEEEHVPLFQTRPEEAEKFDFTSQREAEEASLQAQWDSDDSRLEAEGGARVKLQSQFQSTVRAGSRRVGFSPRQGNQEHRDQRGQPQTAGSFMLNSNDMFRHRQPAPMSTFPDDETERRLRRIEGMVERMSDIQRVQVRADYFRMHEQKEERELAASQGPWGAAFPAAPPSKQAKEEDASSSDSQSEAGEWTEQDGQDLWRSTKEKKKRNPFEHGSYIRKGESVTSFEKLMVVTFKTLEQLLDLNKDVRGLVKHGLAMSEKASAGVYKVNAFIMYDESVRERAGRSGPSTFGQVDQEDIMRFFCYDNVDKQKQLKSATAVSKKKADRTCLRYNGEAGCSFKNCSFAHKCIACEEMGHARKDCRVLKKKEAK